MSAVPNLPESIRRKASLDHGEAFNNASADGFQLPDVPVDDSRPLKVIIIGAGFSGIYLGIRIPQRLRNVELAIYDKNSGVGGTWHENRYPGCACDIPSHSYQYTFNPNPSWSALYAPAREIESYLVATTAKYSVDRFIKLQHKVTSCAWDDEAGKWHVDITNLATGETFTDTSDVLINARGGLNEINWPEIPGFDTFKGEVMHSAAWNEKYDFTNKRVGIIGSGSSSIQIVPNLQKIPGTQLSVFVRNKTWISPSFGQELWEELGMKGTAFSEEQKAAFAADPAAYQRFRLRVEEGGNAIHSFTIRGTETQKGARQLFAESMKARLEGAPDIYNTLLPDFSPGCRRLTPGPGYLEALTQSNVAFLTSAIKSISPTGINTADSNLHEIDTLVCATGFKTSAPPPFPVLGREGLPLAEHWESYPRSYLSLATDKFPNLFMMLGPNSAIGTGSLTTMIENTGDYIVKCVRKLQKENLKSMEVEAGRVDDFVEVSGAYFRRTVFTDECRSWYKSPAGHITGLWPGSTQQHIETLRSPRWEDFSYTSTPLASGNKLSWMGNGWTTNQLKDEHLAWYLYPEFVDFPAVPRPEEGEREGVRPFSN